MSISKRTRDASKTRKRPPPALALPFSAAALHAPVSAVMDADVACVQQDLSEEELITFFVVRGVHATPVLAKGGELSGFVSLCDMQRRHGDTEETELRVKVRGGGYALGRGFHLQEPPRTVADLMTRPAISLEATAPLTRAAALMAFEGVSRLPIVDGRQHVVGMLSALDLLRWLGRQDGYTIPAYTQRSRRRGGTDLEPSE
jgi:CBS-domain-containing membrane protein